MKDSDVTEVHGMLVAITRLLVDRPEDVQISRVSEEDGGTLFQIRSNVADVGKLIGKQGRNARALRTILKAASMKLNRTLRLDIDEPATEFKYSALFDSSSEEQQNRMRNTTLA